MLLFTLLLCAYFYVYTHVCLFTARPFLGNSQAALHLKRNQIGVKNDELQIFVVVVVYRIDGRG